MANNMNITELTREARERNTLTEVEMWKSIELFGHLLEDVEKLDPKIAQNNKIAYIDIVFKSHFPLEYAEEVVAKMHSNGMKGRHWTIEQINETARSLSLSFPSATTEGDKLFAFNSFWHDIHNNGDNDEKIFGDAYLFYFRDEDCEGNTKPFKYYKSMF